MKNKRKRVTLHDAAIELIRSSVGGVDSHHNPVSFGLNIIPDIISKDSVHEVQGIEISDKVLKYSATPDITEEKRFKRILWLALPKGTSKSFDDIKFVEINKKTVENLPIETVRLKPLILPSRLFKLNPAVTAFSREMQINEILLKVEKTLRWCGFLKEAETFKDVRKKILGKYAKIIL